MKSYFKHGLILLGLFVLAGCATPSSRIRKHAEQFNAYPPEIQEKIRQGQVDLGFTREMVSIALGAPQRVTLRKTGEGTQEVWSYLGYISQTYYPSHHYHGRKSRYCYPSPFTTYSSSYERGRIVFEEDKVVSIQALAE